MVATSDAVARVRYVSLLTTAAMVAFAANSVLEVMPPMFEH